MKVREIMTSKPSFYGPESTLEEAYFLMQKNNCGFLPVVGDGGNVIGVVTDRDMCIALGTRNRKPSDLRVWDVMPRKLFTCMEGDDVHCALNTLRAARIRRLPVIDRDGSLVGVLSINDIVLHAREHVVRKDFSDREVEDTYTAVCARPAIPIASKAGVTASFRALNHSSSGE
jgi:CBS domain-containing protein